MSSSASSSAQVQTAPADTGFPLLLRHWRQQRRLSQLDLALSSGVSQRHVSFLESGRANPSRTMILQLSETLDVPLRDRNAMLIAAGFAPMFRNRPLDDPQMAQVMAAVHMILANHAPFPAVALDRAWNIRLANEPFERLGAMMGDHVWTDIGGDQRNLMQLFFHPKGIGPLVANWATVGPLIWRRAQREAETGHADMRRVLAELAPYQHGDILWSAPDIALMPVIPFDLAKDGIKLSMFAVISTFGTAQDVTADELRIESLFPADAATDALFRAMAIA